MANELFDKKIKEKLESVQRPVSQSMWDNIRKKMHMPWYFDFWRKYGLPLYATTATILLLVNLKDKFNYEKKFRVLNEKISTIQQVKSLEGIQTIIHRDTVFINKTVYVVHQLKEKPEAISETRPRALPVLPGYIGKSAELTKQPSASIEIKADEKLVINQESSLQEEIKEDKAENLTNKDSLTKVDELKIPAKTEYLAPAKKTFRWPKPDTRIGFNLGYGFNH